MKYIGGTSIAAVAGKHPWKSRFDLYQEMIGEMPEVPDNTAMERGRRFEEPLLQLFLASGAVEPDEYDSNIVVHHPLFPFIGGKPDCVSKNNDWGVEIKTSDWNTLYTDHCEFGSENDAYVPFHYYAQSMLYAGLTGKSRWFLFVGFLEKDSRGYDKIRECRVYDIPFKEKVYHGMIRKAVEFYKTFVEKRIEPERDRITENTLRFINHRFPRKDAVAMSDADSQAEELARMINEQKRIEKEAKEERTRLEAEMKIKIGENQGLKLANGKAATWKETANGQLRLYIPS